MTGSNSFEMHMTVSNSIRTAQTTTNPHSKRTTHEIPLQKHPCKQRSSLAMIGTEFRSAAAPIGPSIRARTGLGALENVIQILDCAGFLARLSRLRPVCFATTRFG